MLYEETNVYPLVLDTVYLEDDSTYARNTTATICCVNPATTSPGDPELETLSWVAVSEFRALLQQLPQDRWLVVLETIRRGLQP